MKLPRVRFTVRRTMVAVAVVALCLWCRWLAMKQYRDFLVYRQLRGMPLAEDLWYGRLGPGDDVERLIARICPHRVRRRGPFVELLYYPGGPPAPGVLPLAGTAVLANGGRLVYAGSSGCTFEHTYFDVASPSDYAEYGRLLALTPGKRPELGDAP